jgi:hypothetical protein
VGPIAQSVEQRTFNPWVDGSSPSGPTPSSFPLKAPRGVGKNQVIDELVPAEKVNSWPGSILCIGFHEY